MCQALEELMKDRIDEKVNDATVNATINARIADIKTLMDSVKWTAEQAMDALKIPVDERKLYSSLL